MKTLKVQHKVELNLFFSRRILTLVKRWEICSEQNGIYAEKLYFWTPISDKQYKITCKKPNLIHLRYSISHQRCQNPAPTKGARTVTVTVKFIG